MLGESTMLYGFLMMDRRKDYLTQERLQKALAAIRAYVSPVYLACTIPAFYTKSLVFVSILLVQLSIGPKNITIEFGLEPHSNKSKQHRYHDHFRTTQQIVPDKGGNITIVVSTNKY